MRKLAGLLTLLLFCIAPAIAQDAPQDTAQSTTQNKGQVKRPKPAPYTPKVEISAAFTHRSFYAPSGLTFGMNGWDGSVDYNLRSWLGVDVEVLGTYYDQGINGKTSIYDALVGPQIYPFKHHKFTPFGHVLIGAGHYNLAFPPLSPFPASSVSHTASAWDVGGGVDVYVWKNLGVRALQLDYDKASFFSGNLSRAGYRVTVGIVYRFGGR
jgi:opacity protein-like surface antigen